MSMSPEFLIKLRAVMEGDTVVKAKLKSIREEIKAVPGFEGVTAAQITTATKGMGIIGDGGKKAAGGMEQLGLAMRRALIVAPIWMIMRGAIMGVFSALQALPQAAFAWETEMANIKRVGKGTNEEYALLSSRLLDLAAKYGIASATMGQGAALWAQQGKNLTEIIPLMETTIKLSLITGKSVSQSVEDITAIMKSYKVEAADTTSILDKLIKVEQNHAITTNVLTDALKKGGPVAAQFGVSFEKFLGIITATHVATRASGAEIGNAWKTIFARMATSAIPAIQNIAKVPVYMDAAGKATYKNTGTFRVWGNVLDEVMVSMKGLNETQQMSLTSALAMKRTINYFLSAYQNWDEGIKATIQSLDSFGVADKSVNLLIGTTISKTKQLQAAWSELGVTIVNNGQFIKDTIGSLKGLVGVVNDTVLIFRGLAGQELIASRIAKEGLDEEIKIRNKQLGQLKSITELKKLLGETKEFETRIKEEPKLGEEQKNKILTVLQERQNFIQETLDKQPKIEVGELFLESTIARGAELQELRDRITTMATEAYKVAPELTFMKVGVVGEASIKDLENRLKEIKGFKPEFVKGGEEALKTSIKYLEEIIKLRKEETKISSFDYLGVVEERLKNEKEFVKLHKEYLEDDAALTTEQEAQLKMEREMSTFAIQRGVTEEDILQKKIELIKVSKKFNNEQQRTLALEQAQNQLIEARLQKRKREEDSLMSLSMQYEKADMFNKGDIRRTAELSMKKPEDLAAAYQGSEYDKRLIQENLNQFTQAQQEAVAQTTALWKELSGSLGALTPEQKQTDLKTMWDTLRGTVQPVTSPLAGPAGVTPPGAITNSYHIPITLEGAITDSDIQALLVKIDEKIKEQPNYIGNKDLLTQLDNPEVAKKVAGVAANTNIPK